MHINLSDTPGFSGNVQGEQWDTQSQKKPVQTNQSTIRIRSLPNIQDMIKEGSDTRLMYKLDEWHRVYMGENGETPFSNLNELRWRYGD